MIRYLLAFLLIAAPAAAQVRPGNFSTLNTTDTSADSIHVGCAVGSSVCTGGIKAGPVDTTGVISSGAISIANNVPGVTTFKLYNNAGTLTWNGVVLATGASLSGTTNTIPVFTASNAIGNSIMTQAGTTITIVNTLAVSTVTATNLGGTLTTASQTAITGVGTITTGTWSATAIGLAKGGTSVDLSGTGGTSQFLRQNSAGAAITVVRPAISDLSDGTNVALLNAANTFSMANASSATQSLINTTSGTGAFTRLTQTAGTSSGFMDTFSQGFTTGGSAIANGTRIINAGAGGVSLSATGGAIGFYTASDTLRWGVNAAGDFTVGASNHIVESNGTAVINSGFGTAPSIVGVDSSFVVTNGTPPGNGVVGFAHTWSTAPVCVGITGTTPDNVGMLPSTTSVSISVTGGGTANQKIYVICRGY